MPAPDFTARLSAAPCVGMFSKTTDSALVEAAGYAGLDFMVLDTEHGPASLETLHHHVRAAALTPMAALIRVRNMDGIGAALDTGAMSASIIGSLSATLALCVSSGE